MSFRSCTEAIALARPSTILCNRERLPEAVSAIPETAFHVKLFVRAFVAGKRYLIAMPRITLRSHKDGRYVASPGEWTDESKTARVFRSALEASQFVQANRLADVELIISRNGSGVVRVPIRINHCSLAK